MTARKRSTLFRFFRSNGEKFLKVADDSARALESLPDRFRNDLVSMSSEPVVLGWSGKPVDKRLNDEWMAKRV